MIAVGRAARMSLTRCDRRPGRCGRPKTAKVLAAGSASHTVGDLLRHYPRRYAERGELTDLARPARSTST